MTQNLAAGEDTRRYQICCKISGGTRQSKHRRINQAVLNRDQCENKPIAQDVILENLMVSREYKIDVLFFERLTILIIQGLQVSLS